TRRCSLLQSAAPAGCGAAVAPAFRPGRRPYHKGNRLPSNRPAPPAAGPVQVFVLRKKRVPAAHWAGRQGSENSGWSWAVWGPNKTAKPDFRQTAGWTGQGRTDATGLLAVTKPAPGSAGLSAGTTIFASPPRLSTAKAGCGCCH